MISQLIDKYMISKAISFYVQLVELVSVAQNYVLNT